jgi:hypothetical protein
MSHTADPSGNHRCYCSHKLLIQFKINSLRAGQGASYWLTERPKNNSGLSTVLRPLPVDCWDWTGGLRAFASARAISGNTLRRVLSGGWGAMASGLSHLTYDTTGTIILHRLDQPPFPCKLKVLRRLLPSQATLLISANRVRAKFQPASCRYFGGRSASSPHSSRRTAVAGPQIRGAGGALILV